MLVRLRSRFLLLPGLVFDDGLGGPDAGDHRTAIGHRGGQVVLGLVDVALGQLRGVFFFKQMNRLGRERELDAQRGGQADDVDEQPFAFAQLGVEGDPLESAPSSDPTVLPALPDGAMEEIRRAVLVDEPEGRALLAHGAFGTRRIRERQRQLQLVGRLFGEPSAEDPSLDAWYCAQGAAGDPVELVRPRTDGTFERRLLDDAGAARCEEILSVATPGGGEVTWVTSAGAMGLTVRRAARDGVQSWLLPRAVGDSAWISPMVDGAAVMTRDAEARALGSRVRLLALDGSIRPEVFDDVRGAWSFDGAALHVVHEDPATPAGARWSYLTSVTEGVRDALSVRGPVFAVSLEGGEVMAFQEGPLGSERPVQLLTAGDTLRVSAAEALGDVSSLRRIEATGSPPRLAACASGECSLWEREPGGGLRRFAGGLAASIRSLVTRTLDG